MRKILTAFLMLGLTACPNGSEDGDERQIEPGQAPASSALAITADDRYLVIAAEDHNAVVVVERATLELVRSIPVSAGPSHVIIDDQDRAFVTTRFGHQLHVVDVTTGLEKGRLVVGAEPMGLTFIDEQTVAIALSGESAVAVVDAARMELQSKIQLPDADPRSVALDAQGRLLVAHMSSGHLSVLGTDLTVATSINLQTPVQSGPAVHPNHIRLLTLSLDGKEIITAHSQSNPQVVRAPLIPGLEFHGQPEDEGEGEGDFLENGMPGNEAESNCGYGGCPDELGAVVPTLTQVDLEEDTVVIPTKNQAQRNRDQEAGFVSESPTILNPSSGRFVLGSGEAIHNPLGTAIVDGGRALLVVNTGTQNAFIFRRLLDGSRDDIIATASVGHGPSGIALTADGQFAYVFNLFEGSITEIELPVVRENPEPAQDTLLAKTHSAQHQALSVAHSDDLQGQSKRIANSHTVTVLEEALPPDVAYGRILFHDATDARIATANAISCASCHPDGRTDNMTWQFSFGPRNTPQLGGGILDTAPFHWPGDVGSFDDLEHATVRAFMGGEGLGRDMGVVGSYMDAVPAAPSRKDAANRLSPAQARGKAIFESAATGCVSCHSGEDYTNHATLDIGSQAGPTDRLDFQVPVLHGLARSAPYMHDGSAETLEDLVLQWVKTDRMGQGSHLNDQELDDLIRFLESL